MHMRKKAIFLSAVLIIILGLSWAAVFTVSASGYLTNLEATLNQSGTLLQQLTYEAGQITGKDVFSESDREIDVVALILKSPSADKLVNKGLRFWIWAFDSDDVLGEAYVDFGELPALMQAVNQIIQISAQSASTQPSSGQPPTAKPSSGNVGFYSELLYSTKGGFVIKAEPDHDSYYISCPGERGAVYSYLSIGQFQELKQLIEAGYEKIVGFQ